MKRKWFAACLAGVLLLAGCGGREFDGGGEEMPPSGNSMASRPDVGAVYEPQAPAEGELDISGGADADSQVYQNPRAKLIRRAELDIQTEQFDQSVQALNTLVLDCGGYFENSRRHGEYIVRVPAERYTAFLSDAGDLGYLTSSSESTEDVGEQYYDTEARLKTQRTKQERLLALLEKAETMEDIIALESALSEVEYQIESYSSDLNRYDGLINFATFRIYLSEVGQVTQEVGNTASLGAQMLAGLQSSFRGLVQGGQDFLVWVSYNLFLFLFLAAGVAAAAVVGIREHKRKKNDKKEG